ncbi:uncharacterized protein V6R79_025831 [Siganus canaliculatus]
MGESTSEHTSIHVKYAPRHVSLTSSGEIVEGSSVTLTCSSDANPAAEYTWYRNNKTLKKGKQPIYKIPSISVEHNGNYHCKSENEHGKICSAPLHIDVQYAPRPPSVSVSPSGEIVEGSSVTLTCSSDANPAAIYTWYKENEDSPKASGQNFTITDFRAEHSGNYSCEAQNKRGRSNSTLLLAVVADKSTLIINIIRSRRVMRRRQTVTAARRGEVLLSSPVSDDVRRNADLSPTSSRYRRPTVFRSSPTVSTRQTRLTSAVSRQKENSVPPEQLMST